MPTFRRESERVLRLDGARWIASFMNGYSVVFCNTFRKTPSASPREVEQGGALEKESCEKKAFSILIVSVVVLSFSSLK